MNFSKSLCCANWCKYICSVPFLLQFKRRPQRFNHSVYGVSLRDSSLATCCIGNPPCPNHHMSHSQVLITKTCVCGRVFTDLGGFTRHEKSCHKGKKRLASALAKAKEVYIAKKARLSLSRRSSPDRDATTCSSRDGGDSLQVNQQAAHQV